MESLYRALLLGYNKLVLTFFQERKHPPWNLTSINIGSLLVFKNHFSHKCTYEGRIFAVQAAFSRPCKLHNGDCYRLSIAWRPDRSRWSVAQTQFNLFLVDKRRGWYFQALCQNDRTFACYSSAKTQILARPWALRIYWSFILCWSFRI